jgi:hypothetical protein
MRAYKNIKFVECPDVADIQCDGRKSCVGRLKPGEIEVRYRDNIVSEANKIVKVTRNQRGYCSPANKKSTRRYLKRKDRAMEDRFLLLAEQ